MHTTKFQFQVKNSQIKTEKIQIVPQHPTSSLASWIISVAISIALVACSLLYSVCGILGYVQQLGYSIFLLSPSNISSVSAWLERTSMSNFIPIMCRLSEEESNWRSKSRWIKIAFNAFSAAWQEQNNVKFLIPYYPTYKHMCL